MLATRLAITARNSAGAVSRGHLVFPHTSTTPNSHATRLSTLKLTSAFSTSCYKLTAKSSPKNPPKSADEIPPMEFSFKGLGMSRNTKIAVLVILSIFGTIETVFWVRWIWELFADGKDDESERKA
ncbi:hypothetical protein F4821DRAFT_228148 [Hypoxylon rubiginosum]|uniref:Uncharacterized protein n=1 Tax=Hypoxylon rubiginosum TaxID=110542 RepID=A0ACC0DE54_9PEZI|nr:hypothetical protein F4821DRAFT_228148 [Hypoxylon rubiginosum]